MMKNVIKTTVVAGLALLSLSFSAATAEPVTSTPGNRQAPPATVQLQPKEAEAESEQGRQLVTQQNTTSEILKSFEAQERPRGQSRAVKTQRSGTLDKPLLEVTGF